MSFRTAFYCVDCHASISNFEKMYSNGRCPKCGYKHPDACTIVETYERAYKIIPDPNRKWYQFWKKVKVYK